MIRILLLDLGGTLEADGVVLPSVPDALTALQTFSTADGKPLILCLASDFKMPVPRTPEAVDAAFREYLEILDRLGLRCFFEPVEQRVTLSTQADAVKPARTFFETALRRAGATNSFRECLFITENGEHTEACRKMGMAALQFGLDFKNWTDALPLIAYLVDPKNLRNLEAALRPSLAATHGVRLEAVSSIANGVLRGRARSWVPLDAPDLASLKGVHVELPVNVVASIDSGGHLGNVRIAQPSADDLAEATENVRALMSNEQVTGARGGYTASPVLPTHRIETDADGRRYLVRHRFTGM